MDTLARGELDELIKTDPTPCISIYLPMYGSGREGQQNQLRFKNLLKQAQRHLAALSPHPPGADVLLAPAHELLEDPLFWQEHADGLALFVSANLFRCYRLPLRFSELAVVAHHFYIIPLLALQDSQQRFYILALSRNQVRLLQGSQFSAAEVKVKGLPENLTQALGSELAEKQSGFRPLPTSVGGGGRQAIFYGQGAGADDSKDEILRYCRVINAALHDRLAGEHAPLVLAAVDYLHPLYREANTYPHLVAEGIEGNPEHVRLDVLCMRAWNIVEPQFKHAEWDALERYQQFVGTGLTSCEIEEILPAAFAGRVEMLFVNEHVQKWGTFDPKPQTIFVHPLGREDGEELLNLAAIYTLANRGKVCALEPRALPTGAVLAALFRY